MESQRKILFFDYFISVVIMAQNNKIDEQISFQTIQKNIRNVDLNRLKLFKLLFLASTIKNDYGYLLDSIFDNFYALPYGPVESDVYQHINELPNYSLADKKIDLKTNASFDYFNIKKNLTLYEQIKSSVKLLQKINANLFKMSTYELVEITHRAESWKVIYAQALQRGKSSLKMPSEIIKETVVYYK